MSFLLPPISTWAQWSATFDDVRVWKPAIDAICAQEGIGYHHIETPASNTNAVFILDRRVVIKIYSPFWSEFAFERRLIKLLRRAAAVPVPTILAAGQFPDRTTWNYLAMQFCSGRTLQELKPEIPRPALLKIAAQTGRMVRAIHAVDRLPLAGIDKGEPWDTLIQRRRRQVLPELIGRRLITAPVAAELAAILDEVVAAARGLPRVVVHGDLNADHLLLEERNGGWVVSALIDFGDARIGVRDYEWMPLWLGLFARDVAVMRAFLDAYDPVLLADDRLGQRVAVWTLLHDFGTDAIAELFENSDVSRPVTSQEALQALVWPGLATNIGHYGR